MKGSNLPALLLMLVMVPASAFDSEQKKSAAGQEAGKWLALVDAMQYRESWKRTAPLLRLRLSEEQWRQTMSATRKPLGNMISRKQLTATYATSLPGAPDGEYVVLQYKTEFKNKKHAIETVTPMLDNGQWRVSGYYLR